MAIAALVAGGPDGCPKLGTSFKKELPCCMHSHPGPPGPLSGKSPPVFQNSKMAAKDCPATPGCSSKLVAAWAFEGLGVAAGDSGLQKICSVPSWRDCTVGLLPSTSEPTHMYIKISNNENTIIVGHNPSYKKKKSGKLFMKFLLYFRQLQMTAQKTGLVRLI